MNAARRLAAFALRRLDPETAHGLTVAALKAGLGPRPRQSAPALLATRLAGLALPNPLGLAAGFDKNAEVFRPMLDAGFGFVECGTVTPLAQSGNPPQRLFRLPRDGAVINRLGFNNLGLEAFAARLASRDQGGVVGANLGAGKDSTDRAGDYVRGLQRLWGLCDYFTVNVSSPNTPGLRELQGEGALADLLGRMAEARAALAPAGQAPLFLKVAPDLHEGQVETIVETAVTFGLQGLVVANTSVGRPAGLVGRHRGEAGGLSGRPLMARSTQLLRAFHEAAAGRLALIGVGGVGCGADAYAKIRAGANAVQLYTALVFQGPELVGHILRELAERLRADGFATVADAVGAR
jgi:dihydroorotate dehydrogenase